MSHPGMSLGRGEKQHGCVWAWLQKALSQHWVGHFCPFFINGYRNQLYPHLYTCSIQDQFQLRWVGIACQTGMKVVTLKWLKDIFEGSRG